MGMNIKGHVDTRRYNPSRDIAYAWPNLMKAALIGFDKERSEPITAKLIKDYGVTDEELGDLVDKYAHYFKACLEQGEKEYKGPEDALAACGFFDLPLTHQAVILTRMGQVITGAFYYAIRDVHVDSDDPPFNDASVIDAGFKAKKAFIDRGNIKWYHYFIKPWLLFK
jgi:hypothetical protein